MSFRRGEKLFPRAFGPWPFIFPPRFAPCLLPFQQLLNEPKVLGRSVKWVSAQDAFPFCAAVPVLSQDIALEPLHLQPSFITADSSPALPSQRSSKSPIFFIPFSPWG